MAQKKVSILVGGPDGRLTEISGMVEQKEAEPSKINFIRGEDLHDCTLYSETERFAIQDANNNPGRD